MPAILFVPAYTFMDRANAFRGFLDTNGTLYPQLQRIDFRQDVPRLEVPTYLVLGNREARGRAVLTEEWFAGLEAPAKGRVIFDGAGTGHTSTSRAGSPSSWPRSGRRSAADRNRREGR